MHLLLIWVEVKRSPAKTHLDSSVKQAVGATGRQWLWQVIGCFLHLLGSGSLARTKHSYHSEGSTEGAEGCRDPLEVWTALQQAGETEGETKHRWVTYRSMNSRFDFSAVLSPLHLMSSWWLWGNLLEVMAGWEAAWVKKKTSRAKGGQSGLIKRWEKEKTWRWKVRCGNLQLWLVSECGAFCSAMWVIFCIALSHMEYHMVTGRVNKVISTRKHEIINRPCWRLNLHYGYRNMF